MSLFHNFLTKLNSTQKKAASFEKTKTEGTYVTLQQLVQFQFYVKNKLNPSFSQRSHYVQTGSRNSPFRGRGMDFAEFRLYQPGNDDVRSIDWQVTARSGKTHIRLYQQEKERPVFIIVDQSQLMRFGTRVAFKSVIAAQLSALIAWHFSQKGDRIGGLVGGIEKHYKLPPRLGKQGVLPLLNTLATPHLPDPVTDWQAACLHLRHITRPGSLIFLLGDFLMMPSSCRAHLQSLAQHNSIVMGWIYDELERYAPPAGYYTFSNLKNRTTLNLSDIQIRSQYEKFFEERSTQLKQWCITSKIPCHLISTQNPLKNSLDSLIYGR